VLQSQSLKAAAPRLSEGETRACFSATSKFDVMLLRSTPCREVSEPERLWLQRALNPASRKGNSLFFALSFSLIVQLLAQLDTVAIFPDDVVQQLLNKSSCALPPSMRTQPKR